ncbi:hypothetical protein AB0K02_15980 [Streptomyces sp. NPDC049597]|uniref:NucA/NucB deoxyribonuclease domain-containing protein n=1 Tax=Streptomyces sp. NPDC049597 TaxID=3155276 RepID=UPI00342F17ED
MSSPASAADEVGSLHAHTVMLPPSAPVPTLGELQADTVGQALTSLAEPADTPTTPLEVVGPAAGYGTKATVPASVHDNRRTASLKSGASPAAVTYPEPARTMSLNECKRNMGGSVQVHIKSRFAVCTAIKVTTIWTKRTSPIGTSTYTVYIRGTVPKETDRTMYFDYDVVDFTQIGTTGVEGLKIGLKGVLAQDWPAAAKPVISNTLPVTKTWPQMKASPHYTQTVRYAPGQGTGAGAADVVFAVYQPEITSTLPAGWVGNSPQTGKPLMFAPRWDSATYLRNSNGAGNSANRGGAAFSVLATLEYSSQPGAPEQAVAQHIKKAFADPTATKPLNALKNVPGDLIKEPLHRLYLDERRRKRNRAVAVRECTRYWGQNYADGGKECDEFPFATTYEGSAAEEFDVHVEKKNYSVMPLDGVQNGAAGNLLSGFYTSNRMIDGQEDGFIVKID